MHLRQQSTSKIACPGGFFPSVRNRGQPLNPDAVSLEGYKLRTGWLQVGKTVPSRAGHLQCLSAAETLGQSVDPLLSPDVSLLSPELQHQWHADRNMHLGATKIKPYSSIKAVWRCNKCPAGQPHVWKASVSDRTRGTKCPYCRKRRVCLHNSLATIAPQVAQYWDFAKNEEAPEQVLAGSGCKAEWKCPACKYEWKATIQVRVRASSGCPKCSQASTVKHSQPTFAKAQPAELAEWDHERNNAEKMYPEHITLGSNRQVHWVCSCCPKGQPHRWTARPLDRVRNGQGCAVCASRQPCVCNSLESLFPAVAAEFDVDKNSFAPSEVTAASHKKVWWRTVKRGSWRQAVYARTKRRTRSCA
ncbi:hypothetical protein ABBQ32_003652 [Trebouxia sp. C0010 RCD-2024]